MIGFKHNYKTDLTVLFAIIIAMLSANAATAQFNAQGGSHLGNDQALSFNTVVDVDLLDNFSVLDRLCYAKDCDDTRQFSFVGAENNNHIPGYRSCANFDMDGKGQITLAAFYNDVSQHRLTVIRLDHAVRVCPIVAVASLVSESKRTSRVVI